MTHPLDGVAGIDWPALGHAYGSAEDVPGWLAAMTDPATSAAALDELDTSVYHQGGAVYSAGAAVVPFLIRLALDSATPGRRDILELVSRFAALHSEMREPWKSEPPALVCRAALLAAFDGLAGLLDDPEPAVRSGAVSVLVELGEDGRLAGELTRRLPGEADHGVAADYLFALDALPDDVPSPGDPRRLTYLVAARRLGHDAGDLLAAYADARPERSVDWLGRELGDDRPARIALARIAIGQARRTGESSSMAEVGNVLGKWRSAPAELAADIGAALDVGDAAVHLLAAAGDAARGWSDVVAALLDRPGRTKTLAAWALARWGDHRAVPIVARSLRRDPEIFPMGSGHYADEFYWLTQDPGITDVCLPLSAYADELVPAIRWRLRHDPAPPTAHQLSQVLIEYGVAAAAAVPELTAMLDTRHSPLACTVLAGLGPAATPARARLTRLATSDEPAAGPAAWALFRLTGDPEPFNTRFDVLAATHPGARTLGDLGPLGLRHVPDIERRLTDENRSIRRQWEGAELGFAHYRITGDPALCLDVFDAALDPLRHGRQLPVSRQALRYLAEIGPAAARFAPLLHRAATQDERLRYSGGWRGIVEDEQAQTLAGQAWQAIGAPPA